MDSNGTVRSCISRRASTATNLHLHGCVTRAACTNAPARGATSMQCRSEAAASVCIPARAATASRRTICADANAHGACASMMRWFDFAIACRGRSNRISRATSATSSSSAPTECSRISLQSSSTTAISASRTSFAAPIFSRRRRGRYSCSESSLFPSPSIFTCPLRSTPPAKSCRSRRTRHRFRMMH